MGKVLNFRLKKQQKVIEDQVAERVKAAFDGARKHGAGLTPEEYRNFVMLLLADMVVYVIKSGWYTDPAEAIKKGVDILAKRFG